MIFHIWPIRHKSLCAQVKITLVNWNFAHFVTSISNSFSYRIELWTIYNVDVRSLYFSFFLSRHELPPYYKRCEDAETAFLTTFLFKRLTFIRYYNFIFLFRLSSDVVYPRKKYSNLSSFLKVTVIKQTSDGQKILSIALVKQYMLGKNATFAFESSNDDRLFYSVYLQQLYKL